MKPLLSLHDQGTRCSSFFPPPATSPLPSNSAGSSLKRLLLVLVSLGFPCLGECSHASLKHPRPPPPRAPSLALNSQTDRAAASSLLPLPHPNSPCLLWFGQLKNWDTLHTHRHTLIYIYICVLCCFFHGIPQGTADTGRDVHREQNPLRLRFEPSPHTVDRIAFFSWSRFH